MSKEDHNNESGFMASLAGVRRLKFDRVDLHQQTPKSAARVVVKQESVDPFDRENSRQFLHEAVNDSWFQQGLSKKIQRRIKSGKAEIEAVLDLHGYRQQQASRELEVFLRGALQADLRFVLIIHGKGIRSQSQAKLRPMVHRWLLQQPMVLAYCPAQPADGGSGASYVYLKSGR